MFTTDEEIESLSQPLGRFMMADLGADGDETELCREVLSPRGREMALAVYIKAIEEAMQALYRLATLTDEASPYYSTRLRVRMCKAAREEMAALVAEWEAVANEEGSVGQ